MKARTLYLNVLVATLMASAGTAHAARNPALENAIRLQAQDASAAITAQTRADLHVSPFVLDVPGVTMGKVRLVDSNDRRPKAVLETTAADGNDDLRIDLAAWALEVPGMFGVYRYMAASPLDVAVIVTE